uniref:Caleosin n=1 Tax=Kalanchoe fedtschenkoi TaxID=63787 RepID=A0A7N1A8A8_KALFE
MTTSVDQYNSGADGKKPVPSPEEYALKKHVDFFDRNNDGIIYPWETYQGFRAIGAGIALSAFAAVFINAGLSAKTRLGKGFSISLPIETANIKFAKHGSDSDVYDSEGRFVPSKFEAIFVKHARTSPDFLTSAELQELLKANREPKDYIGWVAAWVEWKVLYLLAKDRTGVLRKEAVRGVYDGSLFDRLEREKASGKKKAACRV